MAHRDAIIEAGKLNPSSLIELFVLDGRNIGVINDEAGSDSVFRWHAGTNGIYGDIVFDSKTYYSFPVETSGFEVNGQGQLPRPTIKCANIRGFMSGFLRNNKNLIGAKVYRRRVFARFIDDINFANNKNPYGTANPSAAFVDDIFYVSRKISENKFFIEFELATQLEVENVTLPRRQMLATACIWKYRGDGCGYSGIPIADAANKRFVEDYGLTLNDLGEWNAGTTYSPGDYIYISSTLDNNFGDRFYFVCKTTAQGANDYPTSSSKWIADACQFSMAGCRLRFGNDAELPIGTFPGISRLKF